MCQINVYANPEDTRTSAACFMPHRNTTWQLVARCCGIWSAAVPLSTGCGTTEGPLVVRNHSSRAPVTDAGSMDAGHAQARPAIDVSWQVQLSGSFDASIDVALYYVDLDNLTTTERVALANGGRHVACYLSAGSYEPWRPDAALFPAAVIGNVLADYPDERWLDIRSTAVTSLMGARLDQFKSSGCNSVVVANVTTSGEDTGFGLVATDQTSYLIWLSNEIHRRGLLAGLATAEDRLGAMEPPFDWAYAQGCWSDNHCSDYAPFVTVDKAVLAVEFGDATSAPTICSGVAGTGIDLLIKPQALGASRFACLP
jgi:hypothetical protein